MFWAYKHSRDQKEERDGGEDNEDEDPKCSRKKKPKLSLKADSKEDGEERDDEMVSSPYLPIQRCGQSSWGVQLPDLFWSQVLELVNASFGDHLRQEIPRHFVPHCHHLKLGMISNSVPPSILRSRMS